MPGTHAYLPSSSSAVWISVFFWNSHFHSFRLFILRYRSFLNHSLYSSFSRGSNISKSIICRNVKNVSYNFSHAQVKVCEATSFRHQHPSTALMSEIADLTHNPMAFTEIMSIVWKRLNDSGKNWRHAYKSLVLLDFLINFGDEKVIFI